jgi:hypothetical protein
MLLTPKVLLFQLCISDNPLASISARPLGLSSEPKCNTPADLIIGTVDQVRCYSHLSDDEREQIGLAKAVGHSIGAIAKAIGRPKSTVSRVAAATL